MSDITISRVDPRDSDVNELLQRHWEFTAEVTPPEHIHALDLDGLLDPSVALFALREDGRLLGVGAVKTLGAGHVEIKSMHTAVSARGEGVGRKLLAHLLGVARSNGAVRASLETGIQEAFQPAISLYADAGFTFCGPFADYAANSNSVFMTLRLD
ncbi:MAG: GNAT family N-acetyltransferase [Acidimicrobiia bacterium]|nr:GNAT family N-acetyltransferase [Acidimicrobiia bacterium]